MWSFSASHAAYLAIDVFVLFEILFFPGEVFLDSEACWRFNNHVGSHNNYRCSKYSACAQEQTRLRKRQVSVAARVETALEA